VAPDDQPALRCRPRKPLVGVTLGDPAGIGPEIVVKAFVDPERRSRARMVAIGPEAVIADAAERAEVPLAVVSDPDEAVPKGTLRVIDVPGDVDAVQPGEVSAAAGRLALDSVELAVQLALQGRVDAIATAPWNKEAIYAAGSVATGHTELIAELTGTQPGSVAMMLASSDLRVFHVSTHIAFRRVCAELEPGRVEKVIRLAHDTIRQLELSRPRIAVAALNPHAGEGGLFGDEEETVLRPAIEAARADGIDVSDPIPADIVFWQALRGDYHAVVALYHDQGHIAVKLVGRGHGVNVTVGLPIIRTSVDHGTAFDIAGEGLADPASMIEAIVYAADMVRSGVRYGRLEAGAR
jgi:4-hydroxythreonine-4-phosphate dehydrogenase